MLDHDNYVRILIIKYYKVYIERYKMNIAISIASIRSLLHDWWYWLLNGSTEQRGANSV
jgi:hypothetical protein